MELLARVAAVLRRCGPSPAQVREPEELRLGGQILIDFRRHEGRKGTRPLALSDRAYMVLKVFARYPGEVLSREQLLEEAWGYPRDLNTRTVDNHVVKIRQQIEDDPNKPRHLLTVHGVGYKLVVGS